MGLMDFVGGAALTGSAMMGRQNEIDARGAEQERQARIQDELQAAREKTRMELAQEMALKEEQRKRTQAAEDGKAIQEDANTSFRSRIADSINQKNSSSMTQDDARSIEANPQALKAYGLMPRSRSQEYDDKIAAAESRGLIGHSKELRDQQNVEIARTKEDNRYASNERRLDLQEAEQKRQFDESMRHNKTIEANQAAMRTAAEKLSPTARAQLEMASEGVASAGKSQTAAVMAYKAALGTMDPEQIKSAKADLEASIAGVTKARADYNAIGKAHLPDWKDIQTDGPQQKPPPDGTRGSVGGVVGTIKNGQFVPDKTAEKEVHPTPSAVKEVVQKSNADDKPKRRDFYAEQVEDAERGRIAKQAASKEAEKAREAAKAKAIEEDKAMDEKRNAYLASRNTRTPATPASAYGFQKP